MIADVMKSIEVQHGVAIQRQRLYLDDACATALSASEVAGEVLRHGQVLRLRVLDDSELLLPNAGRGLPEPAVAVNDEEAAETPVALRAVPVREMAAFMSSGAPSACGHSH